ncbi:TetR/AcrR family transcriptional regulator [Frankia sp. AvcI1]|uniref:TetR/AcrR family transcriptional regulator n=1 Tax=Frankia sp. AvcI1 TaxID=573496 RepID=UPI000AA7DE40|nr:TetR/AcrR family transcriptional regulator [Frankia sp. AvcI1]
MSRVGEQTLGRRARLRAQTTAEIQAVALAHMAEGGPDAISLRAIARAMGMSGSAIYGYFATRDALITTLIADTYVSVIDELEAARDAVPPDDLGGRIVAWGEAFRRWSLANQQGFRLIYGDAVPGYQAPADGPVPAAAKRACLGITGLVAAAWPRIRTDQLGSGYQWSDFAPAMVSAVRDAYPDLPPAGLALTARVWGRMHGPVALEIYGHLRSVTGDPTTLYRDELVGLVRSLNLEIA